MYRRGKKSVRDNEEIKNIKRCECLVSIKEAIEMIKCIGIIPHNKSKQKQKRQMFEFVNSFSLSPFFFCFCWKRRISHAFIKSQCHFG